MRNFFGNCCRGNQNKYSMFKNIFRKSYHRYKTETL